MSLLICNGLVLTMNERFDVVSGDVSIRDGRIAAIGSVAGEPHDRIIDAHGDYVLPGFIQTHVHLCQTLFRGYADDRPLMDWLRQRIWPMEAAHTAETLRAATDLATTELLTTGTTAILTMETVHDTEAVFEAAAASGIRATIGKCMMDAAGDAPVRLQEQTGRSIDESLALRRGGTAARTAASARRSRRASRFRARASCSRRSRPCPRITRRSCTPMRPSRARKSPSSARGPAA